MTYLTWDIFFFQLHTRKLSVGMLKYVLINYKTNAINNE